MDGLGLSVGLRWLLGWWLSWHLCRLPLARLEHSPTVSVLIPARNEETTLGNLLSGLQVQRLKFQKAKESSFLLKK